MQRIIGYECFLENTLRTLGEQLGLPSDLIHISTNFITDAMKNTPMGNYFANLTTVKKFKGVVHQRSKDVLSVFQ